MQIFKNHPLKKFNTFGIEARAKYFTELTSSGSIVSFINHNLNDFKKVMILNGGSNVLFTKDFDGLILKIASTGFQVLEETSSEAFTKVESGQNWDEFVLHCLDHGFYGMENLSLIPGNVGAAPMQNIGAYGVEQQDLFHSLEAVNLETGNIEIFEKPDCNFGYRESVFKNKLKDKYLILNVTYRLKKTIETNVEYGAIKAELAKTGKAENPHPRDVSDAVRKIRNSKLPNPDQLGNAGSFFKNPVIAGPDYDELKKKFPDMVGFPQEGGRVKIAAGWLIDHLGWKGKRIGDAGVHEKQALVLVNHGNASGMEILDLAEKIQQSVHENFGISLLPEVNII